MKEAETQTHITTIEIECNTFAFFIVEGSKRIVRVKQHTTFPPILAEDFPNGSDMFWELEISEYLTDLQAVNRMGRQLLKDWTNLDVLPNA